VACIRPENIAIDGAAQPGNRLSGTIVFAAYLGNTLRYDVDLGAGAVFKVDVRDPWHHTPFPMGAAVGLSFPGASTVAIPAGP
jgi:hypothetical protein